MTDIKEYISSYRACFMQYLIKLGQHTPLKTLQEACYC